LNNQNGVTSMDILSALIVQSMLPENLQQRFFIALRQSTGFGKTKLAFSLAMEKFVIVQRFLTKENPVNYYLDINMNY